MFLKKTDLKYLLDRRALNYISTSLQTITFTHNTIQNKSKIQKIYKSDKFIKQIMLRHNNLNCNKTSNLSCL